MRDKLIKYYNGDVPKEYLRELTKTNKTGVSALNLLKAARELGFEAYGVKGNLSNIKNEYLPIIAHVTIDKKFNHFVVIYKIDYKKMQLLIMDPSKGFVKMSFSDFMNISSSNYLIFKFKQIIPNIKEENGIQDILKFFISKYKSTIINIILLSLSYTILNILVSYSFKLFFDEIDITIKNDLKVILLFLVIAVISKSIFNYFRGNLINYISMILDKTLINDAFNHIINLPFLYYKNHTNGDLLKRINDLGNIKEMISNIIVSIFVDLILSIFILVIIFKISWLLSLILIISIILYTIITIIYNPFINDKIKETFFKSGLINNYLVESLYSFETIKNLSIQNYISRKFQKKYDEYLNLNKGLLKCVNKENLLKNIIISLGNLFIIYFGIDLIRNDFIKITSLITFISLSDYLIDSVKRILDLQVVFTTCKESVRRIKEIYNIPVENLLNDGKNIKYLKGNIEIDNLSYSYDGINKVISDLSLKIMDSEKILICGESGIGKSTVMQLLTRYLDNNYQGSIVIDGYELKNIDLYSLRSNISYVSQNEYLYTDSLYENITLGRKIKYKDFLDLTKNTLVDEIVSKNNLNYNYLIEGNGDNLSGGEKARIIIARSILKNSNIYIFDESFNALDVDKERKILEYLFNTYKDKTFIIISHRKSNIDLYNQVIMVGEDGYVREKN